MKKILKILGYLVLLLAALVAVALWLLTRQCERINPWPKRIEDVRVQPSRPLLSEEQVDEGNAYYFLRQLTNSVGDFPSLELLTFQHAGWDGNAYLGLADWLDQNGKALTLWQRAGRMTNGQVSTMTAVTNQYPYISMCLKLLKFSCYQAELAEKSGHWQEAKSYRRDALANAMMLARGGTLINHLVSYAGDVVVLQSLRRSAADRTWPDEELADWISSLPEYTRQMEPFVEAMRYERLLAQDGLNLVYREDFSSMMLATGNIGPIRKFLVHHLMNTAWMVGSTPAATSDHYDAMFSHIISAATNGYQAEGMDAVADAFAMHTKQHPWLILVDDPVGRLTTALLLPALRQSSARYYLAKSDFLGTALCLAIARFRLHHDGKLPDTLSQLVPTCIAAIPEDPFLAGQPFRYRVDGTNWVVYSVGPNQNDDGGRFNWIDEGSRKDHENETDVCYVSDESALRRAAFYETQKKAAASLPEMHIE